MDHYEVGTAAACFVLGERRGKEVGIRALQDGGRGWGRYYGGLGKIKDEIKR
jgi:hypothetical protein